MTAALLLLVFMTHVQSEQASRTFDPNQIEDIQVRGNRRIPSDTVKYHIQSRPGTLLNMDTVRRDLRALYALGYFDDVRVDAEEGSKGQIIIFQVKEKPTIRTIEYKGNKSVTRSEILERFRERKVGLSSESPYEATRIKKAEAVLKEFLAEKGRQNATIDVDRIDVPPNAVALTFNIDEGPKVLVQRIEIEGNEKLSDSQLKRAMKLVKETNGISVLTGKNTYHALKLADDVTRIRMLYADNGYVRANVPEPTIETKRTRVYRTFPFIKPAFPWGIPLPIVTKEDDRYYIRIRVEENDQYRIGDVRVTGNKEFTAEQIKFVLGLRAGEIYNETLLRKGFENLKKLYGNRGYINFTPVPAQDLDEEQKVVNLTINIDEDRQFRIDRIAIAGNTTTRDKVIRREIMLNEGDVYNSALWDLSLLRLNQLGYFEEIKNEDTEVTPQTNTDKVDVKLKVKEKGRNTIGFNGGVSGIGGSFLGLNYTTNNFIGLGETMSISLQGGTRESQYQFSFTEPYLANHPVSLGFSAFATSLSYDQARDVYGLDPSNLPSGVGFENRLNFEQSHRGFNVFGSYPVKVFHRLGVNFQLDNSSTTAVNPATQEFFNSVAARERENFGASSVYSTYYARRLTPTYTYNSTNSAYNPSAGRSFTGSLEFTGGFFGGNVNFYRPSLEYRAFKPVNKGRNTLAVRIMSSYVQGFTNISVPYYERFFLGGDFDIRGFDFRSVSPIAFIARTYDAVDLRTGKTFKQQYDDIVYVGGDTQGVFNLEYRIPLAGPITLAPFLDAGNTWILKKQALLRRVVDSAGNVREESVRFLPGTNSGVRVSAGVELQVVMPVINAPFRLIFAVNPSRIDRTFQGPVAGTPFAIHEVSRTFKFTVGRTF